MGKVLLTKLTTQDVAFLLREDLITQKMMDATATENGLVELISQTGITIIKEKMVKFFDNKELRGKVFDLPVWLARLLPVVSALPEKYDREEVRKWADRYTAFFDSIRTQSETDVIDDALI